MSINGFTEKQFVSILKSQLSVRAPIKSIERLVGRDKELELIAEALYDDGGHVFIYGDRGVGKSSLAATVASKYQSKDNEPIQIPCGRNTLFFQTIGEIAERILRRAGASSSTEIEHNFSIKVYKLKIKDKSKEIKIPKIDSMFKAVDLLEEILNIHSSEPVIVIDEFDQIQKQEERANFAHFIKDLGDRGVNVKFIFTGVASSLYHLLGDHESSFRQLFTLKLDRLYWSYREEITLNAVKAFGLKVNEEIVHSIAKISNGFPYFVHLLTQNLLWAAFKDRELVKVISDHHYKEAINRSIVGISGRLQLPYEKATLDKSHDYLLALWATADSEDFIRYSDNIFKSYLRINEEIFGASPEGNEKPMNQKEFNKILAKFKTKSYGEVLEQVEGRRGLFSYKENLLRGYVALKAMDAGVELKGDEPDQPKISSAMAREKFSGKFGFKSAYPGDPASKIKFRNE
ncbi:AAA family ATPase [Alteromonas sp. KUL106]|uniref:AAA family ATPase n=1 Tax=Alteromonas sp. KUL106 TaxID=2480799 RepID=UPI0012E56049|nr:AAA family ATPase [Alteromonas sp. KUL106]GFD67293.1 DNA-binding protein [Alteromonas sp. KUL106]